MNVTLVPKVNISSMRKDESSFKSAFEGRLEPSDHRRSVVAYVGVPFALDSLPNIPVFCTLV